MQRRVSHVAKVREALVLIRKWLLLGEVSICGHSVPRLSSLSGIAYSEALQAYRPAFCMPGSVRNLP